MYLLAISDNIIIFAGVDNLKIEYIMQKLEKNVKLRGVGKNVTATQIMNDGSVYVYKRSDDVYEVFIAEVRKEEEVYGVMYPEREIYPSNENFGSNAFCYQNKQIAINKFYSLLE